MMNKVCSHRRPLLATLVVVSMLCFLLTAALPAPPADAGVCPKEEQGHYETFVGAGVPCSGSATNCWVEEITVCG
jgi:hypothetical protein